MYSMHINKKKVPFAFENWRLFDLSSSLSPLLWCPLLIYRLKFSLTQKWFFFLLVLSEYVTFLTLLQSYLYLIISVVWSNQWSSTYLLWYSIFQIRVKINVLPKFSKKNYFLLVGIHIIHKKWTFFQTFIIHGSTDQ